MFGAEEFCVERWSHFRWVDIYDELCQWLKSGCLDIASSLCAQFSDVLSDKLISCLDVTLAMVPDEVVVDELCGLLNHAIIPRVLESQDTEMIDRLAAWIEKRASDMEVTQKQGWPVNAIQLCDMLQPDGDSTLFKNVTPKKYARRLVGLAVPQTSLDEARQSQNALIRLRMLRNDLQQIIEMRDKYNCRLSLAEFRSETIQSLAYHLLDRVVAVELVSAAISDMIRPYAIQNCLKLDDLLSSYVEELVHRRGIGGMRASTLWESKAVEILGSISNRELHIRTLLSVLSAAQFPWNEDVSNVVKAALAKNPSHAGLKGQCQLASLKQILIGYDLQSFNFAETTHAKELAFHILMQDRATAVEDALSVTEVYSNVGQADVYLFRCCFLAEHSRANEIVSLLRVITPAPLLDDVCERFIRYCSGVLSDPLNIFRSQYAAATRDLRRLLKTLSSHCSPALQHQLSELDAVHRLDSEFGIFISHNDYCTASKRRQLCDEWLNTVSPVDDYDMAETKCVVKRRTKGCQREVARLLKMSAYNDVFQATRAAHDGNIHTSIELAERMIGSKAKNSVETVRNVLRILKALCEAIKNGSVVTVAELTAIHRVSCNLLLTAPSYMVDQCLTVVQSTRLAADMATQCSSDNAIDPLSHGVDAYRQWTFDDYLSDDDCGGIIMEMKPAMSLAFAFVAATLPPDDSIFQLPVSMPQQIPDIIREIAQLLTASDQTRLFLGYFLVVAAHGGVSELEELYGAVLATLKQCVFRRRADYQLALTAVLSLPPPLARDNLRKLARLAGIQYKKALAVAQVGRAFAQITHNAADLSVTQALVTEVQWGYRLAKVHVSFHECFRANDKNSLIPTLAANKSISVDDVLQYCEDFRLDIDGKLCLYLNCLLPPSLDSSEDVPVVPFHVVEKRAKEACHHISPKCLIITLEKVFEKTSPYDYERLEFILDQLVSTLPLTEDLNRSVESSTLEQDRKLLICLKSYCRVSAPDENELLSSEAARERLPFHALRMKEQRWRIITAELNAETVGLWIPMAAILHLPTDHIYTTAIRNIVQSHVDQLPAQAEWSEGSIDADFVRTVQQLLSQVTNIELAVACVSWIARLLPPCAEKVVAYSWCIDLQEKQVASSSPEQRPQSMEVLEKHRLHSRQTAIEQVLQTNGLAEPSLLALSSGPARLIFRLYEHPSITVRVQHYNYLSSSSAALAGLPDIHAVVDRIAAIGSVDARKVRQTLLDQWLASNAGVQQLESADVTMVGEDSILAATRQVDSEENDSDDVDLLRAVYLLQHPGTSFEDTALMLINYLRDAADASGISASQQIRIFRCLFQLTDVTTVERLSARDNWPDFFATLIYTSELRRLRVFAAGSRGSFETVDKSGLVRALCRCREDTAGRVAACLATDFLLSDAQIWNTIIRRLTTSNLDVLLGPLPCRSREITVAINSLVLSWLDKDAVDRQSAVKVCLLLQQCPAYIDQEVVRRCAVEFGHHNLPLCCLTCVHMLPRDPGLVQLVDSVVASTADGVDAEVAELVSSGRVLPTTRRIMALLNSSRNG